ncbi:hypothetical protein [Streptomyces thinghirensis]|uniref:Uncharacterized protein n=1 Tax=Streptomyces thinghirensis TaxID=551547 RepID=A0ABP9TDC8_9ACTN
MKKQIASAAAALTVIGGAAVFAAPPASAVGCLDGAVSKYVSNYPSDNVISGPYWTTSRCADINVTTTEPASVKVCFGTVTNTKYCQDRYTLVKAPYFRVVAYDVYDNNAFYLVFRNPSGFTARVAA